jgi:Domain of unknown function (DUF1772).
MLLALQVATVFLTGVAMTMALAHALEFSGKLRRDEQTYMAVQMIYYPGFTLGGIGEGLAILATLILMIAKRGDGAAFWWALAAFIALLAMHTVFWLVTQPVNRYWLKHKRLGPVGTKFFALDHANRSESGAADHNWKKFRDRWEYSHIIRAGLSVIALIAVAVAIAT